MMFAVTPRTARRAILAAPVALLLAASPAAAAEGVLTVSDVTVTSSGNTGSCPVQVDVGFLVAIEPTPSSNVGMDQVRANAETVLVDGQTVGVGTSTLYRVNPPWYYLHLFIRDSTAGTHTLWLKGGLDGVRWLRYPETGGVEYAYLASDYTTSFTIGECVPNMTPAPTPTPPAPTPTPPHTPRPAVATSPGPVFAATATPTPTAATRNTGGASTGSGPIASRPTGDPSPSLMQSTTPSPIPLGPTTASVTARTAEPSASHDEIRLQEVPSGPARSAPLASAPLAIVTGLACAGLLWGVQRRFATRRGR